MKTKVANLYKNVLKYLKIKVIEPVAGAQMPNSTFRSFRFIE